MTGYEVLVVVVIVIAFTIIALKKHEVAAGFDLPGKGSVFLHAKDPRRKRKPKPPESRKEPPSRSDEP